MSSSGMGREALLDSRAKRRWTTEVGASGGAWRGMEVALEAAMELGGARTEDIMNRKSS
jgi:hypothetical protein